MWDQAAILRSRRLLLNECTPSAAVGSLCTHLGLPHCTLSRTIRARYSDRFGIRHRKEKRLYIIHIPDRRPEHVFRSVLRGLATIEQQPPQILTWYNEVADQMPLLLRQATSTTDGATTDGATSTTDGATSTTDGATSTTDGATSTTDWATTDGATSTTGGATSTTDGATVARRSKKRSAGVLPARPHKKPAADLFDRMTIFRRWEEAERRLDPELALRSMAAAQARRLLDPDKAYPQIQYNIVWSDHLEGAWRCQQTAPHHYTIFLNKEWLLAMVGLRATLTVGGVTAPSFTKAVLLLVLQAMTRILSRQPGADKAALLRRSGLASLHSSLAR